MAGLDGSAGVALLIEYAEVVKDGATKRNSETKTSAIDAREICVILWFDMLHRRKAEALRSYYVFLSTSNLSLVIGEKHHTF